MKRLDLGPSSQDALIQSSDSGTTPAAIYDADLHYDRTLQRLKGAFSQKVVILSAEAVSDFYRNSQSVVTSVDTSRLQNTGMSRLSTHLKPIEANDAQLNALDPMRNKLCHLKDGGVSSSGPIECVVSLTGGDNGTNENIDTMIKIGGSPHGFSSVIRSTLTSIAFTCGLLRRRICARNYEYFPASIGTPAAISATVN